ncbi:MAG: glycosyltransferase [Cyanobacteriota bacterium]|nr:glycosyltransferase [Cyanobacteriota bacterium]
MLSLSMIVRDEAERLERCLASVAGFVDEMVLLDTGSRDATVAIAERCGAVVHQMAWPGDFGPARNQALEHVKGDWVLVLDADELLREQAKGPLRQLMAEADVLLINLLRHEIGAAQAPYSNVSRLFRRHPAIRWSRRYHAMVDDSVAELMAREPHWRVLDCPVPALLHEGYRPELLASGNKAERLRAAMEAELAEHPGDPYACAKLGALEISAGNRQRGLTLLEQGLTCCPPEAQPERYELLLHLALATAGGGDLQAAAAQYREALALPLPSRLTLGAQLNLALLLLELAESEAAPNLLAEAAAIATAATEAAPELAQGWRSLGLIERRRGQIAAAIAAYRQSLAIEADHPETQQNLAVALLLGGDIDGARAGFGRAIALLDAQGRAAEARALRQQAGAMVKLEG